MNETPICPKFHTMTMHARPKMITLTDAAADRIRGLIAASGKEAFGLRIGIKKGGCAGMEYTLDYAEAKARMTRWSRTRAFAS